MLMKTKDRVASALNVRLRIAIGAQDEDEAKIWRYLISELNNFENE